VVPEGTTVLAVARRTLVAVGQPALIQVETRPAH
jgi:hypothetical protein